MPPTVYRAEAFGIEYLCRQTGGQLIPNGSNFEREIDEGFVEDSLDSGVQLEVELPTSHEDPTLECLPPLSTDSDSSDSDNDVSNVCCFS